MQLFELIAAIHLLATQGRMVEAANLALMAVESHPQALEANTEAMYLGIRMPVATRFQFLNEICARHRVAGPAPLLDKLVGLFAGHSARYKLFATLSVILCRQELPELAIQSFSQILRPAQAQDDSVHAVVSEYAVSADQYDQSGAHHASIDAFTALLAECLEGPRQGLNIVDAACGSGLATPTLRPWAAHLTGLDLSPDMLAIAAKSGRYDRLVEGDMVAAMAAMPDNADLVVCAGGTYYLQDLAPFLAAVNTCLKPGGQVFFADYPALEGMAVMETIGGNLRYCRPAGLTRALAAEHGFAEINCVLELSFNLPAFHWHFR